MSTCVRRLAAFACAFLVLTSEARAQKITIEPVNIQIGPGQGAALLTVANQGDREAAYQIRAFVWRQDQNGEDQLAPTNELLVSPPLVTVAPGTTQIVRLALRRQPEAREATYRILFDQLSAPTEVGGLHIALRMSIPVFAEPRNKVNPQVRWQIVYQNGQPYLVAANDGNQHETVTNVALRADDGSALNVVASPPHILAGSRRRWRIETNAPLTASNGTLRLTASAGASQIDQQVGITQRIGTDAPP